MASINKNSVRDVLDRLKLQFEELFIEGSLTRESKMLMQSMLALISLICAIFLEKIRLKPVTTLVSRHRRQIKMNQH